MLLLLQVILLFVVSCQARFQAQKNVPSRNMNKLLLKSVTKTSTKHFKEAEYVTKPDSDRLCESDRLYLFVLIHSQPGNFKERELVRKTWGSVARQSRDTEVKLLFLMGLPSDNSQGLFRDHKLQKSGRPDGQENSIKSRSLNRNGFHRSNRLDSDRYKSHATQLLVNLESDLYNDILQGNFDDSPLNQTSKHIMGYRWILEECDAKPTFVLKTEDNVFVEMHHLLNFLTAVYGDHPSPSIVCDVIPAGTSPHKTQDQEILQEMDKHGNHLYPKYCSGSAYLITPTLMSAFLKATNKVQQIPLDDIYMTGMVREYLEVSPFYLNPRYTYEMSRPYKWLKSSNFQPLPFIFVVPESKNERSWSTIMQEIWKKSEKIQRNNLRKG